jgi:hypothetical protein
VAAIAIVTLLVFAAWRFGSDTPETAIPDFSAEPPAASPTTAKPKKRANVLPRARMMLTGALGDSWVEVYSNSRSGRRIFEGTVEAGRSVRFGVERAYRRYFVRMGRPANLRMTVNGHVFDLPNRRSRTDMFVTANGIRPAAAS